MSACPDRPTQPIVRKGGREGQWAVGVSPEEILLSCFSFTTLSDIVRGSPYNYPYRPAHWRDGPGSHTVDRGLLLPGSARAAFPALPPLRAGHHCRGGRDRSVAGASDRAWV